MKHFYIFIFLSVIAFNAIARDKEKHDSIAYVTQSSPIKISYFGDNLGVKPGFSIGLQHTFRSIENEKYKKSGKVKLYCREYFYSINFAAYQHKGYNSALYLFPEIGTRKIRKCGFYTELSVGTGLFRTTLGGPTYTVNNSGNIEKVNSAGSFYWAFHVSPGIGWDFSKRNPHLPLQFFIKPNLLFQYPYNSLFMKHFIVETGINYSFSNLLPGKTKTIYRKIKSNGAKN
jgi:hypothetical protein